MGNIVRLPRKSKPVYQCTGASVTLEKLERGMLLLKLIASEILTKNEMGSNTCWAGLFQMSTMGTAKAQISINTPIYKINCDF